MKSHKLWKSSLALAMSATLVLGTDFTLAVSNKTEVKAETTENTTNKEESTYLIISSARELNEFAQKVNNGNSYEGKTIKLANDIEYDGVTVNNFTPIGNYYQRFGGIFDGAGHTIKGINITQYDKSYIGLFGFIDKNAIIKNLIVADSEFGGKEDVGGIVGVNSGVINNCYNINCKISGSDEVGGIAGLNENSIKNCISNGNIILNKHYHAVCGGITGFNNSNGKIYNSGNLSNISPSETNNEIVYVGGIAGIIKGNSEVQNCYNIGKISSFNNSGGIVGYVEDKTPIVANSYTSVESCASNFGTMNGVEKNIKALPVADMKTNAFLEQLNTNKGDNADWLKWEFRSETEYPVLVKVSDFSTCQINLNQTTYEYTGKEIIPSIKVSDKDIELQKDKDYSISYKNNTDIGTATVTITGLGNYSGTVERNFTITAKNLANANITLAKENYVYNESFQKPSVSVKIENTELKNGTDYTLTYENNKNAGTASIHIQGKGNYTGTIEKTFLIKKGNQKIEYTKKYKKVYKSGSFYIYVKQVIGNGNLTYKSSNKKVATVNKKGKVTVKKIGKTIIKVTAANTNNYNKKSVKITVQVSRK